MALVLPHEANARVITVSGKRCRVDFVDGTRMEALIRGRLLDTDSAVAVGDFVVVEEQSDCWTVERILPRHNEFVRLGLRNERQVLFANVDRALIFASISEPGTKTAAIDRFLAAAMVGGIEPWLVVTKTDLDLNGNREAALREVYESFQLPMYPVCNKTGAGADELLADLGEGITGLVGNSGVGKSSLLNRLIPGLELKVQEVSTWSGKGKHTTTAALLVPLGENAAVIDTAGMKSFVPYGITRDNLADLFPEIAEYSADCRFRNCRHLSEPDCAVRAAAERGDFSGFRLRSYYRLLEGVS
jgi:ribosome biogenesis GTPase